MKRNKTILLLIFAVIFSILFSAGLSRYGGKYVTELASTKEYGSEDIAVPVYEGSDSIGREINVPFNRLDVICLVIAHDADAPVMAGSGIDVELIKDGASVALITGPELQSISFYHDPDGKFSTCGYIEIQIQDKYNLGEGKYELAITGRAISKEDGFSVLCDESGSPYVKMKGETPRHPAERYVFCFLYVLVIALIIVRMIAYKGSLKKERLDDVIVLYTILLCTFTFTYFHDTEIIYEQARVLKSALKHGQLFNFYDYALENSYYRLNANYNILLYVIAAVCFLPFDIMKKICGDMPLIYAHLWFNAIVGVMFYFTGTQVRRVLKVWNIEKDKAELTVLIYYMNPILLFATVGFSQLDIFYISAMLEALILFEKGKTDRASLLWSLSIAMKTFPVMIFIPLLLLREKRLTRIIRHALEAMSLSLIFSIIYGGSEGWKLNQLHSAHYKKPFMNMLPAENVGISLFVTLYLIIMFICWARKTKADYKSTILCSLAVYTVFTVFMDWLPQYPAPIGIFLALAFLIVPDPVSYLGIESFFSLGLLGAIWLKYEHEVDNYMVLYGIPGFKYSSETPLTFSQFADKLSGFPYKTEAASSMAAAACVFLLFYAYRGMKQENKGKADFPAGYIYLPVIPLFVLLIISGLVSFSS